MPGQDQMKVQNDLPIPNNNFLLRSICLFCIAHNRPKNGTMNRGILARIIPYSKRND